MTWPRQAITLAAAIQILYFTFASLLAPSYKDWKNPHIESCSALEGVPLRRLATNLRFQFPNLHLLHQRPLCITDKSSSTYRVCFELALTLAPLCWLTSASDRIYLAAYTGVPDHNTPFPYPATPSRSPTKRSSRTPKKPASQPEPRVHPPCYFSIDDELPYNRFHADFGPLHMGHLYRFSLLLNYLLSEPNNQNRAIVLWSRPDSRSRANAACLLACYMILVQTWPPHLALSPIAQIEPPIMPFRDAGYSQADFSISIQDILYGVWRAKNEGLCSFDRFNLVE